ncbi:nitrile hydratase accessory protein [Candidatus Poriferisodalis sp.]|uniref:nitrile hydratase accessory protein n=1 Tax=Candidatus Poriferisodalis sp. TaxID=3101277 RepID=UPI003B0190E3
MSPRASGADLLVGTVAEPPRDNGELVFSEPWQARAFGLAADLVDGGHLTWHEFREQLIGAIAEAETETLAEHDDTPEPRDYYRCWLTALERVVARGGWVTAQTLAGRAEQYAARPVDHDH